MEIVTLPERRFAGISLRTRNGADPDNPEDTIGALWGRFWNEVAPSFQKETCCGVYTDYESDQNGMYRISATVELEPAEEVPDGLEVVSVPAGRYMVFRETGQMPDIVMDTWQRIWDHFEEPEQTMKRTFVGDVEVYPSDTEVVVYIGIQE